jgi:hypothetical protein
VGVKMRLYYQTLLFLCVVGILGIYGGPPHGNGRGDKKRDRNGVPCEAGLVEYYGACHYCMTGYYNTVADEWGCYTKTACTGNKVDY